MPVLRTDINLLFPYGKYAVPSGDITSISDAIGIILKVLIVVLLLGSAAFIIMSLQSVYGAYGL